MSLVWDSLIDLQNIFIDQFASTGTEVREAGMDRFNQPGWINRVWSCDDYRRAHIDVVDMRESKKVWMMHVCVFPHLNSDAPIYGFDVVAGPNKMTGAFHDFSATTNLEHGMIDHFGKIASRVHWKRERELPPWAKAIFTDHMIAAGMIKEPNEIAQICSTAEETLGYYLENVADYSGYSTVEMGAAAQNNYAHYQKQNPHTPAVMKSLGLNEDDVDAFVNESLFPEI